MRPIALVSEHASPLAPPGSVDSGGQNIYVANLAKEFAAQGHRVDVFTRQDDPMQARILNWIPGVRVIHVPAGPPRPIPKEMLLPYMKAFGEFLTDYFRSHWPGYDVVHANFFMSGLACLPATRECGMPLVVTFHALDRVRRQHQGGADQFPAARYGIELDLVRHADRLIAECPQDLDDLIGHYGADPAKIAIVPCGFDAREPAKLYVVGGDAQNPGDLSTPELLRLHDVAEAAGVADAVEFCGRRDRAQLALFYGACDVFVTTPWYEPFGITPVKAMACARPVVGSAVGGIQSTVVDGKTGFLVPPRDPEALAGRLAYLAAHPSTAQRFGRNGRRRAQQMFTWGRVAAEVDRIYADACRARDAGRTDAVATPGDEALVAK